ncbi:cupin domain-containing protein [Celeribacter marinus]|uniref:cupin domain-containing protein n=1 Tax=Celeribacter marinus TaxID=1397108 RepID=UPI00317EC6AF
MKQRSNDTTADALIARLGLMPHPEGGHYRQTWIAPTEGGTQPVGGNRPHGTCIYFLLKAGETSHWHRVDAVEIWHYYAGAPLILSMSETANGPATDHTLGPDVLGGDAPQIIVQKHHWQAARTTGNWTLVGCTVSPAFHFDGFELAEAGFDIPRG